MKAYLIDPESRTITETDGYTGDYKQIYPLIDADLFDIVHIGDEGDTLYVDDEGLYRANQFFFTFVHSPDYPAQPLAGKALVLGSDDEGNSVEPKITIDQLRERVGWLGDRHGALAYVATHKL